MCLSTPLKCMHFVQCTFNETTIAKDIMTCVFTNCTFRNVDLQANIMDVTFKKCSFHATTMRGKVQTSVFKHCRMYNNAWMDVNLIKSSLWKCTLKGGQVTRGRIDRCTLTNVTIEGETWSQTRFQDNAIKLTRVTNSTWTNIILARNVVQRTEFADCVLSDARCATNKWQSVIWRKCNQTHGLTVGDEHYQCRCVNGDRSVGRWKSCKWLEDAQVHTQYTRTQWDNCDVIDGHWTQVRLVDSKCRRVSFDNVVKTDVAETNTMFVNCSNTKVPTVLGRVHEAEDAPGHTYELTFYVQHYPVYATTKKIFRLRPAMAIQIDFIQIKCIPGWFTFGFSNPPDVRHLIKYISLTDKTCYWPSNREYMDATTGEQLSGYAVRRTRRRSHSF